MCDPGRLTSLVVIQQKRGPPNEATTHLYGCHRGRLAALAACGSGDDHSNDATSGEGSTQTVAAADVAGIGEVLVDSAGMALYTADQEADGQVRCSPTRALRSGSRWNPADQAPTALLPGVGELGVIERPDGAQQVTA